MSNVVIEDLISLFLNQKIDKDTLLKILSINNISHIDFNKVVIDRIREKKRIPVLKISSLLDDKFLKELKRQEDTFTSTNKYDLDSLYKSNKFLTYKMVKRFLRVEELGMKIEQYFKVMGVNSETDKETVEYLYKGLEVYIKKLLEKCEVLDIKSIKKGLGKDKNILNIY